QRVESQHAAGDHCLLARIPLDDCGALEPLAEMLLEIAATERRGQQDARVALTIVEVDRDDELLTPEALRIGEVRAAPVRERVARVAARAPASDAIGIREREENA